MNLILEISVCLALIGFGAFFGGSETGVYRLSRVRLRLETKGRKGASGTLARLMEDSAGLVFSLLLGNNLVHYIVTSLVTVMFLRYLHNESAAELYTTVLMTPVLFVFSEVIPKNVYYHKADSLMVRSSPALWFFHKLFTYTGVLFLLKSISRTAGRLVGSVADSSAVLDKTGRSHIREVIHETHEEGILSQVQSDIMNRLVNIPNTALGSVMVAAANVKMLPVSANREQAAEALERWPYTRLPVYKKNRNNIIGFINIYEVLSNGEDFKNLSEFVKPIERFSVMTSVIDAINIMRNKGYDIVLIMRSFDGVKRSVGIVTMKDLVEEVTGELAQW